MERNILPEKKDNSELENCTFIKTVLMIIVVLGHSIHFWTGDWFTMNPVFSTRILKYLSEYISNFHVYGFAVTSGYLFYCGRFERGKYKEFKPFLKNKVARLIIPYFFICCVWLIPIYIFVYHGISKKVLVQYLLGIRSEQLWFLLMLFGIFMIAFLQAKMWRHDLLFLIISVVSYTAGLLGKYMFLNIFQIWNVLMYISFFGLGFKIRQHLSDGDIWDFLRKRTPRFYAITYSTLFLVYEYIANSTYGVLKNMLCIVLKYPLNLWGGGIGIFHFKLCWL